MVSLPSPPPASPEPPRHDAATTASNRIIRTRFIRELLIGSGFGGAGFWVRFPGSGFGSRFGGSRFRRSRFSASRRLLAIAQPPTRAPGTRNQEPNPAP